MAHIKLDSGFEMEVNTEELKKWNFFKALRKSEDDTLYIYDVVEIIAGDALDDLLRSLDKSGNPKFEEVQKAVFEILDKAGEQDKDVKNS